MAQAERQTTLLMWTSIASAAVCCSLDVRSMNTAHFWCFILSVALVCGESSVNINDAIFFKLDNFSIFSARSHSSSCEVFHGAKILRLNAERKWRRRKDFSLVIQWSIRWCLAAELEKARSEVKISESGLRKAGNVRLHLFSARTPLKLLRRRCRKKIAATFPSAPVTDHIYTNSNITVIIK